MIELITGVPGAGKTLNTIARVDKEYGQDRQIYYRGIADLQLPWTELSDQEARDWYELPTGSVIVIDEAHQVFPMRSPNAAVPDGISRMDTHRHGGYEILLITQQPKRLDFQARGYVGSHRHFERAFGWEATRELHWQECVDDPKDYHRRQEAQISRVNFPKNYYNQYKSAEIHTIKKRIPKKAWVFLGAILFTSSAAVVAYNSVMSRTESDPDQVTQNPAPFSPEQYRPVPTGPALRHHDLDPQPSYGSEWIPRVKDMPWSAPMYDQVTEVKTYPRPQCIRFEARQICICFTQQATRLEMSQRTCNEIVAGGWFDPFKAETEPQPTQGGGEAQPQAPGGVQASWSF